MRFHAFLGQISYGFLRRFKGFHSSLVKQCGARKIRKFATFLLDNFFSFQVRERFVQRLIPKCTANQPHDGNSHFEIGACKCKKI